MVRSVKKFAALALCSVLIGGLLLSSVFIVLHSGHTHDHNGPRGNCAECAQLTAAVKLLRSIFSPAALAAFVFCARFLTVPAPVKYGGGNNPFSLVLMKVRMNN